MGLTTRHPTLRWAVPGAVIAVVLAVGGLTAATATATATLPERSAAQLLVDVQTASVTALSGTVVQTADLGLPELPISMGGRGSADFTSLVSGTHTLRMWYDGDQKQRLALLGTMDESDVVRNGSDVWMWSSADNTATHYQLPARPDGAAKLPEKATSSALAMTPQQAADAALAAIEPTTSVTTDGAAKVAGLDAYELVLSPKAAPDAPKSLIGQVRIAIDAEKHIPLRVRVYAAGAPEPAFEVGFSEISFETPGPEHFQFSPPPGATVTESTLGKDMAGAATPRGATEPGSAKTNAAATGAEPRVVGTGWSSIVVATLPSGDPIATAKDPQTPSGAEPGSSGAGQLQAVLGSLPRVSGTWGSGRLLTSALFTVLITDDGRVLGGAVAPEALYAAAEK